MAEWALLLLGAVQAEIQGENPERFFNIANQRELVLSNISKNERISFWTTPEDFRKMKDVARKTKVRIRICSKRGLPFFLYKRRKRKLFAAGIVTFILLLYVTSLYIWDISIEGNHRFTDEMLLRYMETIPVTYGMKKKEITCSELEEAIRKQFPEISWTSAQMKGTRLMIRVKENEAYPEEEIRYTEPCDLTAKSTGTITGIVVRDGFPVVKAGDRVEPGDLLVDGTIPIYDDSAALINSYEIHADAEIYANTVHTIQKTLPTTRMVRARTGEVRKGIFLKVLDQIFYLILPTGGHDSWEMIHEQRQLKILHDFYLPIYIGDISLYEYQDYEKNYTEEELNAIFRSWVEEYMEKLKEKGIQILASDGKIEQNETGWKMTGTLSVIENIAVDTRSDVQEERGDLFSR